MSFNENKIIKEGDERREGKKCLFASCYIFLLCTYVRTQRKKTRKKAKIALGARNGRNLYFLQLSPVASRCYAILIDGLWMGTLSCGSLRVVSNAFLAGVGLFNTHLKFRIVYDTFLMVRQKRKQVLNFIFMVCCFRWSLIANDNVDIDGDGEKKSTRKLCWAMCESHSNGVGVGNRLR